MKRIERKRSIIKERTIEVLHWIKSKDIDMKELNIDLDSSCENTKIVQMLEEYMREIGCSYLEEKTAYEMVLNPNSGEWIKGMIIVMAQMGLVNYFGKIVRGDETFQGMGEKELRRKYVINRIAFIRAIFQLSNIQEVILYRGMASEGKWVNKKRALIHMTFSKEVAESFSTSMADERFRTAYLVKMPVCIDEVFMTYVETKEMNEKYKEREAIILGKNTYNI